MGERGPPPKPTALRIAGGNPSGRPLNADEPVPPAGMPEPPDWLDERARAIWDDLVPRLVRVGLARTIDGAPLARYCVLLVQFGDAARFVEANGLTYAHPVRGLKKTEDGADPVMGFRAFPHSKLLKELNDALVKLEREFGLTPAARTRIRVNAEKESPGDVNSLRNKFFQGTAAGGP